MRIKRSGWYAFTMLSILFTNCKKHDHPEREPASKPPTQVGGIKKYVPIKFESDDQTITLKYLDGLGLISEMENSDGSKEVFIYNDKEQLTTYEHYEKEEQTYSADYYRDTNGIATKINQFHVMPHRYEPAGYYTLIYNTQNQLSSLKSYDVHGKLLSDESRTYNTDGNINEIKTAIPNIPDRITTLTYDQKDGIFKYVADPGLLAIEVPDNFFFSTLNNIQNYSDHASPSDSLTYSYSYNTDGYPLQYTLSSGNSKKVFKITYKFL